MKILINSSIRVRFGNSEYERAILNFSEFDRSQLLLTSAF